MVSTSGLSFPNILQQLQNHTKISFEETENVFQIQKQLNNALERKNEIYDGFVDTKNFFVATWKTFRRARIDGN